MLIARNYHWSSSNRLEALPTGPYLQVIDVLNQNTRMGMKRCCKDDPDRAAPSLRLALAPQWAVAAESFDVGQLLALMHQEYAHCPHPKTLHERLSDIGSHGGRY